jgi:hypothetical protein
MKVPLLDLKLQYQTIKEEVMKVTEEIFESQFLRASILYLVHVSKPWKKR